MSCVLNLPSLPHSSKSMQKFGPMEISPMSFISKNKSLLYIASCLFVLLACGGRAALGQIGAGSLTFVIDNVTAENGVSDGGTGAPITLGTSLLAGVGVHGVSGNGGSTSVQCYANGSEIFSWNTSSDGQDNFNWKPTVTGEYSLYCSGTWTGRYANGTVTTPTINIAVTYTTISGYINPK